MAAVERSKAEGFPGAFSIVCCDDWGVRVAESLGLRAYSVSQSEGNDTILASNHELIRRPRTSRSLSIDPICDVRALRWI